jgi:predicted TIM-barrel fold metal-dependent hydrolase
VPSRREVLVSVATAGAAALLRPLKAAFAEPSHTTTKLSFKVPADACDCHVHIFGDRQRFPMSPTRTYTPAAASVDELRALHRALHIDRVVIVQPSVYGTDNSCTLDAIKQLGSRARGVAVIDEKTSAKVLDQMSRSGIRGVRINLGTAGQNDAGVARERLQSTIEQVKGRDWHIQIYTNLAVIAAVDQQLMAAPMRFVFDHFGGAKASLGVQQPGFDSLRNMVQSGKAYVKISGAYRASSESPDYPDVAPLAQALLAANPQRILWGSDWPHPDSGPRAGRRPEDLAPRLPVDDALVFNRLAVWAPEASLRKTILVDNPARLYGF